MALAGPGRPFYAYLLAYLAVPHLEDVGQAHLALGPQRERDEPLTGNLEGYDAVVYNPVLSGKPVELMELDVLQHREYLPVVGGDRLLAFYEEVPTRRFPDHVVGIEFDCVLYPPGGLAAEMSFDGREVGGNDVLVHAVPSRWWLHRSMRSPAPK